MAPPRPTIIDPAQFAELRYDEATALSREELERFQLQCARRRLGELRPRVPVLDRLAKERGIEQIDRIEDLTALLFPHTLFKAYPLEWLDAGRFDRMTRWLGGLTSLDLSGVDCSGIDTIDDWIEHLDKHTELRVIHTFGTSGKLSFIPRTRSEWEIGAKLIASCIRDWHGRDSGPDLTHARLPLVFPSYRFGAGSIQRGVASAVDHFAGGDHNALFLYPNTRFSADVAALAGRVRAADVRGEADTVPISPRLRARHKEFSQRERTRAADLQSFFAETIRRYAQQDIYLLCVWPVLYDWAHAGLASGLRNVFGPGSLLHTGGGIKGRDMPPGWREEIHEFLGFRRHYDFYAMSELVNGCPQCAAGNYHVPPVTAVFLLDPVTGEMLPRSGRARGRLGAFDLAATSSWGGVISGDEVTLTWDIPCDCGLHGPYIAPDIRRYSAAEGGTDKVSCAGANDAYERAIEILIESAEVPA